MLSKLGCEHRRDTGVKQVDMEFLRTRSKYFNDNLFKDYTINWHLFQDKTAFKTTTLDSKLARTEHSCLVITEHYESEMKPLWKPDEAKNTPGFIFYPSEYQSDIEYK